MSSLIMLLWSLFKLWGSLGLMKIVYFGDYNKNQDDAINKIEEAEKDGSLVLIILFVIGIFITDFVFWMIMTLAFTNPFIILYGCIVLALNLYNMWKFFAFINKREKTKKGFLGYIIAPLNIVMIVSYIVLLLF